jgi:hypothetical protein
MQIQEGIPTRGTDRLSLTVLDLAAVKTQKNLPNFIFQFNHGRHPICAIKVSWKQIIVKSRDRGFMPNSVVKRYGPVLGNLAKSLWFGSSDSGKYENSSAFLSQKRIL